MGITNSETLFWTAMVLIIEPILAAAWPRVRAAFMLSFPITPGKLARVETYFEDLKYSHRFGIMMPLRKHIRTFMQTIGVLILIAIAVNSLTF